MRKLSFLSILITLLAINILAPKNTYGAGEYCCEKGYVFIRSRNECQNRTSLNITYKDPLQCLPEERCYGEDEGADPRGVCLNENATTSSCCPANYTYRETDGKCWPNGSSIYIEPTCETGFSCYKGTCIESKFLPTLIEYDICGGLRNTNSEAWDKCDSCIKSDGVWTALGCISFEPKNLIKDFLTIAITIAGGIALLLMIYGSFLISTSAGDPKKAEEGKEIITGTIAGLLFIIFSVVLLRLIGVEILNIPGF